ncbi:MAG: GTP-binding protein HSR1 [Chloroflexi bacterium]|nr:MAG: GTP-binding protein HSR1 [Chloroflexota bacterium]RLC97348.1 MAG: GTP-binding protein HSR1 [Chloroflexota bacterium]
MPANLTPEYFQAEKRYRRASTPQEKIEALEEMLSVMPKHKGTDRLRAELRTKLAKSYDELEKKPYVAKKGSLLYHVKKEGAAQVVLVGLPNVGKSHLVSAVTEACPEVADYPFTTQMPVPGMMKFENTQMQLVDVPAVTAPQVDSWLGNVMRNADLLLIIIDLTEDPLAQMETILERLKKFRMTIVGPPDEADFRTIHKRCLIVFNKSDLEPSDKGYSSFRTRYGGLPMIRVSAKEGDGLDQLGQAIYDALDVIRVYTKAPGQKADLDEPCVVRKGSTVEEVAATIHKDFVSKLKYAQVWGSGKFDGQKVKRQHVLQEGDIIELHA